MKTYILILLSLSNLVYAAQENLERQQEYVPHTEEVRKFIVGKGPWVCSQPSSAGPAKPLGSSTVSNAGDPVVLGGLGLGATMKGGAASAGGGGGASSSRTLRNGSELRKNFRDANALWDKDSESRVEAREIFKNLLKNDYLEFRHRQGIIETLLSSDRAEDIEMGKTAIINLAKGTIEGPCFDWIFHLLDTPKSHPSFIAHVEAAKLVIMEIFKGRDSKIICDIRELIVERLIKTDTPPITKAAIHEIAFSIASKDPLSQMVDKQAVTTRDLRFAMSLVENFLDPASRKALSAVSRGTPKYILALESSTSIKITDTSDATIAMLFTPKYTNFFANKTSLTTPGEFLRKLAARGGMHKLNHINTLTFIGSQAEASENVAALVALRHLINLNIVEMALTDAAIVTIVNSPNMQNLTDWNLARNIICDPGVQAIAASANMRKLRLLNLGKNYISHVGAIAIATSENLRNLRYLSLRLNQIGDAGAIAIAASENLTDLISLNLRSNYIGDAGAMAIAASAHLRNLTSLNLQNNKIGEEAKAALKARFPFVQL